MPDLVLKKIGGVASEAEHEKIAKIVKLATAQAEVKRLEAEVIPIPIKLGELSPTDELTEAKAEVSQLESELTAEGITTRISMAEYPHSVGLVMGELWLSAPPENLEDLRQKVLSIRAVKLG